VKASLALLLGIVTPGITAAQSASGAPVVTGQSYTVPSRRLGESRVVDVTLPAGYDANLTQHYPVLYVLDGEVEGQAAVAVARFYASTGQLPPMIVVGIRNTARTRDLTPAPLAGFTPLPDVGAHGGADAFLAFLADELIPWVDQRYRVAPMRVLVGHSLGGLFALYALAGRPELFAGYVIMEPATWWNSGHELTAVGAALGQAPARRSRVMLVNVEPIGVDTTGHGGDRPMVRQIRIRGETHASMALPGMMEGLRTMFSDFQPPRWEPGTHPIVMLDHYDELSRRLGFTVPIPEPVFEQVFLMSALARYFDDADRVLARLEREQPSVNTGDLRAMLAEERAAPAPDGLVPLVMSSVRPTPRAAAPYLGRWALIGGGEGHEVEFRASGDTIVVHERVQLPDGEWDEDDVPVIGMTAAGQLEWGQRVFRGVAALLVLRGALEPDGTMTVTREVRGWVPRGPIGQMLRTEEFRRLSP